MTTWTLRRRRGRSYTLFAIVLGVGLAAAALIYRTYRDVPDRNNDDPQVDALLVLGSPAELDGSVTPMQCWRVNEAVREFEAHRAGHIVLSGGAAANAFVEAHTMAQYAQAHGVPPEALIEEDQAHTTLENIRNSERILDAHGWRRVEVISSAEHLPRAALLLEHTHLLWHTHPAPTPGRSRVQAMGAFGEEAVGTAAMRLFGPRIEPVLHGLALLQHAIGFSARWILYRVSGLVYRLA